MRRILNSIEKKYVLGYLILAFCSMGIFLFSVLGSIYQSDQYRKQISRLTSINNLDASFSAMNNGLNLTYLWFNEAGIEEYRENRIQTEKNLVLVETLLQESFVRELADTEMTISSYMELSEAMMEELEACLRGDRPWNYNRLEEEYDKIQEVYTYASDNFHESYRVQLGCLSETERVLDEKLQRFWILQVVMVSLAVVVCIWYLYTVIRSISHSLVSLKKGMEEVQKDIFGTEPIQITSGDELQEFAEAFNKMTGLIQFQMKRLEEDADIRERLSQMEIENLKMFSELQKSHLDFLQSRVNPHFLFNTLNMISSLARIEDAEQSAELTEITASFLRYNLDNISKTVSLRKEMENLKEYIAIQKYRFQGRYQYSFSVEDGCLDFQMPCMVLQPLVENAIQHGLNMRLQGGRVEVRVYEQNCSIHFEVSDNGVGMTEEEIAGVYQDFKDHNASNTHIGLRNIYRRLQLFYQNQADFKLVNLDEGLRIEIVIPLNAQPA